MTVLYNHGKRRTDNKNMRNRLPENRCTAGIKICLWKIFCRRNFRKSAQVRCRWPEKICLDYPEKRWNWFYFQQWFFFLWRNARYRLYAWCGSGTLQGFVPFQTGYLFCNGKGLSERRKWRKSSSDEKMVQYKLSLYCAGTWRQNSSLPRFF